MDFIHLALTPPLQHHLRQQNAGVAYTLGESRLTRDGQGHAVHDGSESGSAPVESLEVVRFVAGLQLCSVFICARVRYLREVGSFAPRTRT